MGFKRRIANHLVDALAFVLRLGRDKTYRFFLDALWERYPVPAGPAPDQALDISLFCPDYVSPDPDDRALVERIFTAYKKASRGQQMAAADYQPSSMWRNVLRQGYAELTESLAEDDLGRFHYFLANFAAWNEGTGIEESRLIRQSAGDRNKRRHFQQKIMAPLIRWWLKLESNGHNVSALTIPRHGNLGGMLVNGHLVSPGSVFSEVHARLLAGFVQMDRPIIGELGGGFGRLFYFLSRHLREFCYVGFDLPETLCCASYFLMKAFPEKRFLLYGEKDWEAESLREYDFLLLPSFEISKLPDDSVDLFINENSLGEVEASACRNYVDEICRCANAFWHRNHESHRFQFEGNTTSLVNREYPIPADKFEEVVRYCDVGPLVRADRLNPDSDMVWYYYRSRYSYSRRTNANGLPSRLESRERWRPHS